MTNEYAKKLGLRPCLADGKKGYFHKWDEICSPVAASLSVGGAPAGQCKRTFALVELEDGTVKRYEVNRIQFLDDTYDFEPYIFADTTLLSPEDVKELQEKARRIKYDKL